MGRWLQAVLWAALVGLSAGCIPESDNPVTPLVDARQDRELLGAWTLEEEDCVRYLHIGGETDKGLAADEAEPGLMRLWFLTHRKNDNGVGIEKPFSMRFFVSRARDNHFANAVLPFEETPGVPAAGPVKYYLIRYKVDGDQLSVWGMSFEGAAAAIEAGELGGVVKRDGKDLKSVQLTDSSEHLMVYLSGGGADKLFNDKQKSVFRRVR